MIAPIPSESAVLRACMDYLNLSGYLVWRQNSGAVKGEHKGRTRFVRFNSQPGMSDLIAVKDGRFFAIEVKKQGGRVSKEQTAFLNRVDAAGGVGMVVHSVDELKMKIEESGR